MGIAPDSRPSDIERSRWVDISYTLEGRIFTLEQLKGIFPADEKHSTIQLIEEKENYKIFGLKYDKGYTKRVAYQCNKCSSIVAGCPNIHDENSISDKHPLSGREGYELYCANCQEGLEEVTLRVS